MSRQRYTQFLRIDRDVCTNTRIFSYGYTPRMRAGHWLIVGKTIFYNWEYGLVRDNVHFKRIRLITDVYDKILRGRAGVPFGVRRDLLVQTALFVFKTVYTCRKCRVLYRIGWYNTSGNRYIESKNRFRPNKSFNEILIGRKLRLNVYEEKHLQSGIW